MAKADRTGDDLLQRHREPARHYHTAAHILAMLDGMREFADDFAAPDTAALAIFFHDAIYDPARSDNEAQSARLLQNMLGGLVVDHVIEPASAIILATKAHEGGAEPDINLVIDLDMAVLGAPWDDYLRYAKGVMAEYVPVYGEDAYRQGRCQLFLAPVLAGGSVFLTPRFKPLDGRAMANMAREQELLLSGAQLAQ